MSHDLTKKSKIAVELNILGRDSEPILQKGSSIKS